MLLLEGTRRVVGIPLTLIAFLFAAYMYCGQMLPGDLKGLSFTMHEVVEQIYLTDEGNILDAARRLRDARRLVPHLRRLP